MENVNEPEILGLTRSIYHPQQKIEEIDAAEAIRLGRALTERGYHIIGGMAVFSGTNYTVGQALKEIDHSRRYEKSLTGDPDILIGPRYELIADNDFCPPGIGIWRDSKNEQ